MTISNKYTNNNNNSNKKKDANESKKLQPRLTKKQKFDYD